MVAKFDLDGYILSDRTMAQLIQNGEAIERNLDHKVVVEKKEKNNPQGKKAVKFAKAESKKELKTATYTCTYHGQNRSHNTENCYVLNKQKPSKAPAQTGKRTFTKNGLKHEINLLCQSAPKGKVLDQYLAVIHKEKAKLKKRAKRHKKAKAAAAPTQDSDTDSDSDMSMNLLELSPPKKQKHSEHDLTGYEQSEEEKAYLKAIHADEPDSPDET